MHNHKLAPFYTLPNPNTTNSAQQTSHTSVANPLIVSNTSWYMDSGATDHVISSMNPLYVKSTYRGKQQLQVGNAECLDMPHTGTKSLPSYFQISFYISKIFFVLLKSQKNTYSANLNSHKIIMS